MKHAAHHCAVCNARLGCKTKGYLCLRHYEQAHLFDLARVFRAVGVAAKAQARIVAPTVATIQAAVCARYGLSAIEMQSDRRARYVARPRQIAMYLARDLTRNSLPTIGRLFGDRDHTTVMHACRQVERLMAVNPEIETAVARLTAELTA